MTRLSVETEDVTAEVAMDGHDPLIGVTLDGRFRIVDGIGKGAMGKVYRAVQLPLNRAVALKILDSNYGAGRDETFRQRFLVEAELTAKLSHPNTVRIIDYGCTKDGIFYLAMEYLEGQTLDRALANGALPWRRVLAIGQQAARALREAHDLGVVHRDLKPANIMLLSADDDTDHVKVLDFGLVKSFIEGHELEGRAITQQGMLMGSPPYMAPEQGDKNRADPRSDIYSLGTVLYEAFTGRPPFTGGAPLEIILKHVHEKVPPMRTPPGMEPIPPEVQAIVMRSLAKSPMDRFQTMEELLAEMNTVGAPVKTPSTQVPAQTPPPIAAAPVQNRTVPLIIGFVIAMSVGVALTALVLKTGQNPVIPPKIEITRATPTQGEMVAMNAMVTFHIASEPGGALVRHDNRLLGVTPVTFELPPDANGRASAELTLTKEGYAPLTVTASGNGPRIELSQRLQRLPPPPVVTPPEPVKQPVKQELLPRLPEKTPEKIEKKEPKKSGSVQRKKRPAAKLDDDEDEKPSKSDLKRPK